MHPPPPHWEDERGSRTERPGITAAAPHRAFGQTGRACPAMQPGDGGLGRVTKRNLKTSFFIFLQIDVNVSTLTLGVAVARGAAKASQNPPTRRQPSTAG